jgi:hypothetical protein
MLFYLVPTARRAYAAGKPLGEPLAHKIPRGCTYAASLCKNVTHYHQKLPTRGYRVPKCIPKAHFGEPRVTLFLQNLQKWSLPKRMVCTVFSRHLAGCGSSLCHLHSKKNRFNIMVSTFLCLGGAKEKKICQLGHPVLPKDTKGCPK